MGGRNIDPGMYRLSNFIKNQYEPHEWFLQSILLAVQCHDLSGLRDFTCNTCR